MSFADARVLNFIWAPLQGSCNPKTIRRTHFQAALPLLSFKVKKEGPLFTKRRTYDPEFCPSERQLFVSGGLPPADEFVLRAVPIVRLLAVPGGTWQTEV